MTTVTRTDTRRTFDAKPERTLRRILIKSRFHHELAGLQVASKLFTFAAAPPTLQSSRLGGASTIRNSVKFPGSVSTSIESACCLIKRQAQISLKRLVQSYGDVRLRGEIVGNLRLASIGFHRTANASLSCFCLIATRIQHFVGREFWRINRQQKSIEREPCDGPLFRRVAGRGRWRSWWRKRSRSWAQDVDCRMPFWMRQSQQPLASELLYFFSVPKLARLDLCIVTVDKQLDARYKTGVARSQKERSGRDLFGSPDRSPGNERDELVYGFLPEATL